VSELLALLRDYSLMAWRYRWYGLAVSWFICVAGWLLVATMPDIYQSSARIYVDTDSMLRPLMRGLAVEPNLLSEVEIMQKTLLSRPNLEKVARATNLDRNVRTPGEMNELTTSLGRKIGISTQGRNLFLLSAEHESPKVAKAVVDTLLNLFVESNLGNSRKDLASAVRFIDEQVRDYERQLDLAERKVAEFRENNLGFLPGEGNYFHKLELARAELSRTQGEIEERVRRRDEFARQLAEVPQMIEVAGFGEGAGPPLGPPLGGPGEASGPGSAAIEMKIAELERLLDNLLSRYTPRHPDVLATERELGRLNQQLEEARQREKERAEAEPAAGPASTLPRSMAPNPVYEQLKLRLATEEGEIASLKARAERQLGEVKKWEQLARAVPGVQAELARLTRDYEVMKRNYDELLNRRQSAKLAQDLDTQTDKVQFRIIEPPIEPTKPSRPNRLLFLSVVWGAALGGGVVFAFFLGQLDQTVRTVDQLRALVHVPVLGSVSLVEAVVNRRAQFLRRAAFGAICIALGVAYLGVVALNAIRGFKITV
jgi:polysaccharide chain length determinant protein (PEP-CTERM system associated)